MFVVEMSSTGAEILCRMVPALIVKDRFGVSGAALAEAFERRVVKALDNDIFAE
jgi:predicted DsbA family dithiol-disulfide isomerase